MFALSVVYAYYNQPQVFQHHLQTWGSFATTLLDKLEFIVVDDGSSVPLQCPAGYGHLNLRVLRIEQDIPWNQPLARNLGVSQAQSAVVLISDLDHLLEATAAEALTQQPHELMTYYVPRRYNPYFPAESRWNTLCHPGTICVEQSLFWQVGGYDSDFCGSYGHDDTNLCDRLTWYGCRRQELPEVRMRNLVWDRYPDVDMGERLSRDLNRNHRQLLTKREHRELPRSSPRITWHATYVPPKARRLFR